MLRIAHQKTERRHQSHPITFGCAVPLLVILPASLGVLGVVVCSSALYHIIVCCAMCLCVVSCISAAIVHVPVVVCNTISV